MTDEKDKRIMPPPMRMVAEPHLSSYDEPACQKCGGEIEGWTCQGCGQTFRENDTGALVFAASPPPGELREAVAAILSRGFIGQQSRMHGGQWYVIGLNGERLDALHDSGDEAEAALIKHLTDAILSAIGAGHE